MTRHELTQRIRQKIESGEYSAGALLPPERAMAEQLGTSRPTLRRALEPLVKEGVLEQQPGRGILVPDESSRHPWRIIALLLPDFTNRFFAEVAEAIEYAAFQRGYQVLLCNSRHQAHLEEQHLKQLAARKVDGVILAHQPNQAIPQSLGLLTAAGIPTVLLFSSARNADCDSVVLDDRAGVEQALRYLSSLGHRHIAYCLPLGEGTAHPRDEYYQEFIARSGSVPAVLDIAGKPEPEVLEATRRMLQQEPAPTACFAGNDHVALLLLRSLAALKVRVPEQFSVVGFDNLRLVEHLPVPLTTVDQPKAEMGRRAAELLFERIDAGPALPVRRETFQPHLIIRDSSSIVPRPGLERRRHSGSEATT